MGASRIGCSSVRPSSVVRVLAPAMLRSTRGWSCRVSHALRLARKVISSPAPPLK